MQTMARMHREDGCALFDRPAPPPRRKHPCDEFPVLWFRSSTSKPLSFLTVTGLARALVRTAGGAALEGVNQVASFPGDLHTRRVVAVWTLGAAGSRNEFLGYMSLRDEAKPQEALHRALQELELRQWNSAA
jgi:hypothetical protein